MTARSPRPLPANRFATARRAGIFPRGLLIPAMLFLLAFGPAAASGAPRDLQAHGSDERLWLARAEPLPGKPTSYGTTLFVREKFSPDWRRLPALGTRVIGLGSRGSQLAILL